MQDSTHRTLYSSIQTLERLNAYVGRGLAWLVLGMVVLTFAIAVLRYVFNAGWVWMQELVMYLHAFFLMLAAGYALLREGHVRVDVFYREKTERHRAMVDFWGTLLLLVPFSLVVLSFGTPYVVRSWLRFEASPEAGGLPLVFFLKSAIVVLPVLLLLQGAAVVLRSWLTLNEREVPPVEKGDSSNDPA